MIKFISIFNKKITLKLMKHLIQSIASVLVLFVLSGCATTETSTVVQSTVVRGAASPYVGKKVSIALGKFNNRSTYQQGIFSDGVDRLGSQARTILATHLNLTNRFSVLDRDNLDEASRESGFRKDKLSIKGARFLVTGAVTEFGRKEVGDKQLFGILGSGRQQIAYAKITLNVLDATTSEVVFSSQGAGEYALSSREVIGFGSTASYDFTLNGKVLDLAMREAVDGLVPFVSK